MTRLLCAALLPLLFLAVPAAADPDTQYLLCSARNRENTAGYVSQPTAVKSDGIVGAQNAWNALAMSKYGALGSSTGCMRFTTSAAAEAKRATMVDGMKDDGLKITDVAWSYTAPPPVAAAPAAPTTSEQAAQAEVPQSKAYCEQNLRGLFDCDCFARAVLHHRLANPNELTSDHGDTYPPPVHDLHVGVIYKLDCTECLDDQRLMAWVRKNLSEQFSQQLMTHLITQAQADRFTDCVAKAFPVKYRATPYLHKYLDALNEARISCGNPNG